MWACYKGRTDVVELLLSHGANPSVTGLVSVNGGANQVLCFLKECFRPVVANF